MKKISVLHWMKVVSKKIWRTVTFDKSPYVPPISKGVPIKTISIDYSDAHGVNILLEDYRNKKSLEHLSAVWKHLYYLHPELSIHNDDDYWELHTGSNPLDIKLVLQKGAEFYEIKNVFKGIDIAPNNS